MPVMGGVEATVIIRDFEVQNGLERLPIVALTAHAMLGDREKCIQAGMDDYLTKPLRKPDLLAIINKVRLPPFPLLVDVLTLSPLHRSSFSDGLDSSPTPRRISPAQPTLRRPKPSPSLFTPLPPSPIPHSVHTPLLSLPHSLKSLQHRIYPVLSSTRLAQSPSTLHVSSLPSPLLSCAIFSRISSASSPSSSYLPILLLRTGCKKRFFSFRFIDSGSLRRDVRLSPLHTYLVLVVVVPA